MATKPAAVRKPAPAAAPAAAANDAPAKPARKGKKGLMLVLVAILAAGGGAWHYLKRPPAEAKAAAPAPKPATVFLPIDTFTVNLSSSAIDRYLQLGLTLEVANNAVSEELKTRMPVIRSRMLLLLAAKTPEDLASTAGKQKLMGELLAEARAPLPAGESPTKGVEQVHFSAFVIQ